MREMLLIILICCLGVWACTPDRQPDDVYRSAYLASCALNWKDSGYQYRLSEGYLLYANSNVLGYRCQVNVNGRWVGEDNVKVG